MSGPIENPLPDADPRGPVAGGAPDPVAELEHELTTGDGSRLARYTRRARTGTRVLALLVVGTGVLALLVGEAAFRDTPVAMLVVAVLCLPAIVLPLYVASRTGALATAAGQPREMAAQAGDLISRVRDSAELRSLATRLAHRRGGGGAAPSAAGGGGGRIRGALSLARLVSTVVGQAQPDEARHPLLIPFTPERLARVWSAIGLSLWAWAVAGLVLVVSVPALLVSFV